MRARVAATVLLVTATTAGCGASPDDDAPTPATSADGSAGTAPEPDGVAAPTDDVSPYADPPAAAVDAALRRELLGMLRRDQAARTDPDGGSGTETDQDRTNRLAEITDRHGWPGIDLVGARGEEAAWAIAQHSDLDPAFQEHALAHLRGAVAAGQASPGNLAYLEDRVAVGAGRPQPYGTQVRCGPDGPEPATPLRDPDAVDDLRSAAGLPPLADYLDEMTEVCAGP